VNYSSKKDYEKLRYDLKKYQKWPSDYIFKFIILNELNKIEDLLSKFDLKKCRVSKKESSNKKYISITIIKHMKNPDEVINKYIDVSKIDGIISL
jgi:putative lipoic acid-binding regulatory protein